MPDARLQRCRESYAPSPLVWYDVNQISQEALDALRTRGALPAGMYVPTHSYGEIRYTGPPPAMWHPR